MDKNKSTNIKLISIEEDQFSNSIGNRDLSNLTEDNLLFQYKLNTCIRLTAGQIVMSISIRYVYEEKELLLVGNTLTFEVENLNEIVTRDENAGKLTFAIDLLPTFISISFGSLRGIVYKETKHSVLEKYPLPLVSMEALKDKIAISVEE